jgi:hypothetical protein
MENLQ